jgi:hypothetical protein
MEELRNSCARRSRADTREVLELPQDSFRVPSPHSADPIAETLHKPRIRCQAQSRNSLWKCGMSIFFRESALFGENFDINAAWTDAKQHLTSALAHCSGTTVECARIQEVGLRFSYGASTSGAAHASDIAALSGQHLDIARACGARAGGAGPHDVSFQHFRFFLTGDGFAKLTADHLFQLPHQDS